METNNEQDKKSFSDWLSQLHIKLPTAYAVFGSLVVAIFLFLKWWFNEKSKILETNSKLMERIVILEQKQDLNLRKACRY